MPTIIKNKARLPWENKPTVRGSWVQNKKHENIYNSKRWRMLAQQIRDNEPFCRNCAKKDITTLATVTDHIIAVRLGGSFWNENNLQPLCTSCHNAKKT